MFIKKAIVPAMVSSYILYRPNCIYASALNKVQESSSNFPKYFFDKINELNERDSKYASEYLRESLIDYYPNRYKYIVDNIQNNELLEELDYIRVIYTKPLSYSKKIQLRNKIHKLIKEKSLSRQELELFEYLLKYYDCLS